VTRSKVDPPLNLSANPVQGIVGRFALTLALIAAVTVLRMGLGFISPTVTPFAGYYLAVLAATIFCGWRFGALALGLGGAAAWFLFLAPIAHEPLLRVAAPFSLLIYLLSGAAIVFAADYLQRLVRRLQDSRGALVDRNVQYDTLFDTMSEGFALGEAIWSDEGRLIDYLILEINPALLRMLGRGPEMAGSKFSSMSGRARGWLALCERVLRSGAPESFEFQAPAGGRSYEIRVSRISESRMAQFFFDITDRKAAQARQAEMFEELNHRVKNNLSLVAGLLQMQARGAEPAVRDQLTKAVDRVQSIAQVHQALYRGSRSDDIDFGTYLKDLCASLSRSLVADGRISLDVEAEAVDLPVDTVIPLGMVVNELVTNAIKYAYPPPETGLVSVRFHRERDQVRLSVGDGGRGLPEPAAKGAGGLGMTLVNSLVGQVHGKLVVRRHPGATFEITVPAGAPVEPSFSEEHPL
jgi:two-component sensor histidine kinase/PAS domain-containing protein